METPSQERVQQEGRTRIEKEAKTGGATGASEELAAAVKTSHDRLDLDLDLGLPRGEGDVRKNFEHESFVIPRMREVEHKNGHTISRE